MPRRAVIAGRLLVAALAVLAASSAAADGVMDIRGTTPAGDTQATQSTATLPPLVLLEPPPKRVPTPRLVQARGPRGRVADAPRGTVFSSIWLVDGRIERRDPSSPVRWPAPAKLPRPGRLFVSFGHIATPSVLEVRVFAGPLDADGLPVLIGTDRCSLNNPDLPRCRMLDGGPGILVPRTEKPPEYVSVFAIWFVPESATVPGVAGLGFQLNATWLFHLKPGTTSPVKSGLTDTEG